MTTQANRIKDRIGRMIGLLQGISDHFAVYDIGVEMQNDALEILSEACLLAVDVELPIAVKPVQDMEPEQQKDSLFRYYHSLPMQLCVAGEATESLALVTYDIEWDEDMMQRQKLELVSVEIPGMDGADLLKTLSAETRLAIIKALPLSK